MSNTFQSALGRGGTSTVPVPSAGALRSDGRLFDKSELGRGMEDDGGDRFDLSEDMVSVDEGEVGSSVLSR